MAWLSIRGFLSVQANTDGLKADRTKFTRFRYHRHLAIDYNLILMFVVLCGRRFKRSRPVLDLDIILIMEFDHSTMSCLLDNRLVGLHSEWHPLRLLIFNRL